MKEEIRSFGELAAPRIIGEGRTIEGYAIVFNQESRIMYDDIRRKFFVEVIEPRAVTMDFLRSCDIKLLVNHNKERMLARSFRGLGSLEIEVDEYGVKYRTEAANDAEGNAVLEHIRRGDYFGSSFVFVDAKDGASYAKIDDKTYKRTVTRMAKIIDFAVVNDPAYLGATVEARDFEEPEIDPEEHPRNTEWPPEMLRLEEQLQRDTKRYINH